MNSATEWPNAGSRDCSAWNGIPISKPIRFFVLTDPIWCGVSVIIDLHGCGSWPSVIGCNGRVPDLNRPPRYPIRGDAAGCDASRSCDVERRVSKARLRVPTERSKRNSCHHRHRFVCVVRGTIRTPLRGSIDTLDRNALDARSLESPLPPEQQNCSNGFRENIISERNHQILVEFRLGQFECSAGDGFYPPLRFGGRSAGQHRAPWFTNPRSSSWNRKIGPVLVGSRARLWRCWGDSPRSDWLAEHAPHAVWLRLLAELAQNRLPNDRPSLRKRALRQSNAEGTDLSLHPSFLRPWKQAFRVEDMDRAIMMFPASCVRSSDWQGARPQRACLPGPAAVAWHHSDCCRRVQTGRRPQDPSSASCIASFPWNP